MRKRREEMIGKLRRLKVVAAIMGTLVASLTLLVMNLNELSSTLSLLVSLV